MPTTMSPEGMDKLEQNKQQRLTRLQVFKSQINDPQVNEEVLLKSLRKYNDEFEPFANALYMVHAVNAGFSAWTWLPALGVKYTIAPEFVGSLINVYLCATLVANGLARMTDTDLSSRLDEMKEIYDCLLKKDKKFTPEVDNTQRLNHPETQRIIRLIGPLCTPEFMIVWPKITQDNEPQPGFFSSYGTLFSSYLWKSTKPTDSEALRDLKQRTEKGQLAMNSFDGFLHATRYFLTDPRFKELALSQLPTGLREVPAMVGTLLHHSKQS